MTKARFEWDKKKNIENRLKHGVSFESAQQAFFDPRHLIAEDAGHSFSEPRLYCIGRIPGGILMVRFTVRRNMVRIIGAGYWRKGKKLYEKENQVHR
jgi:hypothetical protein